jgi:LemA protein
VENQLQRRADLIPNLVATVEGYAVHEEGIFKELANARSRMMGAGGPAEKAAADQQFTSALSRLLVVVENYPNLKADVNFRQLQDELAGTENRLAVARMDYNNAVQAFNTRIKRFPTMLWVRMLGFEPYEYFEAQEGAQQVPTVKFKGTGE